jgi:hypothetical protein
MELLYHTIVFKEKRHFFHQKSLKLVIITLTPPASTSKMNRAASACIIAILPCFETFSGLGFYDMEQSRHFSAFA